MVAIFYASDTIEYGRKTLELSNAALHIIQDVNIIEQCTLKS